MSIVAAEAAGAGGTAGAGGAAAGTAARTAGAGAARTAGATQSATGAAGGSRAAQSAGRGSAGGQRAAQSATTAARGIKVPRVVSSRGGTSKHGGLKFEYMAAIIMLLLWPVADREAISSRAKFGNWARQMVALTLAFAILLGIGSIGKRTNRFATIFGFLILLVLALSRQGSRGAMLGPQVLNGLVRILTPRKGDGGAGGVVGFVTGNLSRTGAGASAPPEEGSATSAGGGGGGNSGASATSASKVAQQRAPRRNALAAPRSRPGAPDIAGLRRNPATGRPQSPIDVLPPLGGEPIRGGRPTLRLPAIRPDRAPQVAPDAPGILGVPFRMQRGSVVPQLPAAPKRRTVRGSRTRGQFAI